MQSAERIFIINHIYIWFIIHPGKSEKKSWNVLEFEFIFLVGTMFQLTKTFFSLRARQFFKLAKPPRTTTFDKINFFFPNFVFCNGNVWGGWKGFSISCTFLLFWHRGILFALYEKMSGWTLYNIVFPSF